MSNNKISLKMNFFMNALLTMSSFLFQLITFPYITRVLLPVGTGKIAFATSLISYFSLISQMGIPTYGIRICARMREDKYELSKVVHELLLINIIMCILTYFIFGLVLIFIPQIQKEKNLYIIISSTILFNAIGMEWLYKGLEQYKYITIRSIIFKLIALILMFALVHSKKDYLIYGTISVFAASASNIMNFIHVRKFIYFKPLGNYNIKKHIKPILIFLAMSCATNIYTNLDSVMLGFMKTETDVGYYDAAVKVKRILVSIVTSLGAVLLPRASLFIQKKDFLQFNKICSKALKFVFTVSLPLIIYFILFSYPGIILLSGSAYKGAVIPMIIIMPTLLLIGLTNIMGLQMLVPLGQEKIVLYSEIAGVIVDCVINMLMIPHFASSGASFGTLIAELVVLLIQLFFLKERVIPLFKDIKYNVLVTAIVAASILSAPIMFLKLENLLTIILSSIIFFGVYTKILFIFKEPIIMEIINTIKKYINNFIRKE